MYMYICIYIYVYSSRVYIFLTIAPKVSLDCVLCGFIFVIFIYFLLKFFEYSILKHLRDIFVIMN